MRFPIIVGFIALFILCSFSQKKVHSLASSTSKTIAIYDRDSLLREMPGYQRIVDSVAKFRNAYDAQLVLMFVEFYKMRDQFYKDSSGYNPMVKELKREELQDIKMRISEFSIGASEDINARTHYAFAGHYEQIYNATTKILVKKKKPFAVYNRAEFEALLVNNKPPGKVVDVNDQMRMLLGIKKTK